MTDKLAGTANQNPYGGANTDSYREEIEKQYAAMTEQQGAASDEAVKRAEENLAHMQELANASTQRELGNVQRDQRDATALRDGIEAANGNRRGIGHSQYDAIENTGDQQRAAILAQQRRLETDTARQVADLRAKGDYAKADAALQSARQKFQTLYADAMRVDRNLRGNYEYETTMQREDDQAGKRWLQSMGEKFLQRGVIPTEAMLGAMGLDRDTAQLYINAVRASGYYGGGGRSGGGSKADSPAESSVETAPAGDDASYDYGFGSVSKYNNKYAKQVFTMASSGNLKGAMNWLGSKSDYFSEKNMALVAETAKKQYYDYMSSKHKPKKTKQGGAGKTGAKPAVK